MAYSKPFQRSRDFISNVLDIVCDEILEHLPISIAAQTSVLSKRWRRAWLSLKKLNFDADFWAVERGSDWGECSCIISSVLFHHNGPVHDFHLYISYDTEWDDSKLRILSQWISFLSKNGVRKIVLCNNSSSDLVDISSYIFCCSELVHLEFSAFNLNPPPTDFSGFPNLKHLELVDFRFTKQNNFSSLIGSCRMLVTLKLVDWNGIYPVVIDAPCLQTLILKGNFESLAFGNVHSLVSISLHLFIRPEKLKTAETVDAINLLATSCQLQSIEFNGQLCELLAAGGNKRSTSVTFNHLHELCLSDLNLDDVGVFHYVLSMIECCPYIKKFDISIYPDRSVGQPVLDLNYNFILDHLREVYIKEITGSTAELKLVEYLLVISPFLENVFIKAGKFVFESGLNISRALLELPRVSPKARLFFQDYQWV